MLLARLPLSTSDSNELAQVFYFFGAVGLVWSLWWERLMGDCAVRDPEFAEALDGRADKSDVPVPWRAFLRNRPTQALAGAHFVNNWEALLYVCVK